MGLFIREWRDYAHPADTVTRLARDTTSNRRSETGLCNSLGTSWPLLALRHSQALSPPFGV